MRLILRVAYRTYVSVSGLDSDVALYIFNHLCFGHQLYGSSDVATQHTTVKIHPFSLRRFSLAVGRTNVRCSILGLYYFLCCIILSIFGVYIYIYEPFLSCSVFSH